MIRDNRTDDVFDDDDLPGARVSWPMPDNDVTIREMIDDADVERYLYDGRDFDPETGLQYNRARHFDPTIGRRLNEEPVGYEGGDANLYRYVGNAPCNDADPTVE